MVGFPSPFGGDNDDGGLFDDYEQFVRKPSPNQGRSSRNTASLRTTITSNSTKSLGISSRNGKCTT